MRRYIQNGLLLLLLLVSVVSPAQVETVDTNRLVLSMLSGDTIPFRKLHAELAIQVKASDKKNMAESFYNLAFIYHNHGLTSLSLKYFINAAKLAEETGSKERLGWCYMALGGFYKGQANSNGALQYLTKGLKIFKELGNKHGLGSIYNTLGDYYEHRANYPEALKNYFSALYTLKDLGEKKHLTWPYFNIGEVYMYQGKFDSAKVYYDSSLAIQQSVGDSSGVAWTYNNMGSLLIKKKDYLQAEKYCLAGLSIADSLSEPAGTMNAYRNLCTIYEALGQYDKALKYYKSFNELSAKVSNEENTKNSVKYQMQYDFDKQQQLEKSEQDKKDMRSKVIALFLVLIILVAVAAFYSQRRSNKLKAALLRQKEVAIAKQEMLMKEIHHRVKNNLQITGTLLNLQLEKIDDENAKEAITESIARVNTISLIHNQLYTNEQTSTLDFSHFATELHKQLKTLYISKGQEVVWYNQMSNLILDIDTAIPLGLIINELITNSYKHAFKTGAGMIKLTIEQNGGLYTFSYTDDGQGLPPDIDISESKGLGMMIIKSLSKQIGGAFKYIRENNTFIITFKDAAEMKKTA
jgi:two-component sensor histidine kinase/Tfp pilus assembly protein PilF